jgi:hypothetical protein
LKLITRVPPRGLKEIEVRITFIYYFVGLLLQSVCNGAQFLALMLLQAPVSDIGVC